ncbi:MAG: DUF6431 domain-containing protein [Dehalococcoidales bacterium]|nr:DUF6431 domain-containing protein [Dehalococcoidales bacterium]
MGQIQPPFCEERRRPIQLICLAALPWIGLNTMVIVVDFGRTVQEYIKQFHRIVFPRPSVCPICQALGSLIGHGFYPREPLDQDRVYRIFVKRWRCKGCHHSTSSLPSFLLRFRHYLLAVIQQVITSRHEDQASHAQVAQQCAPGGFPSPRTLGRWLHSFAEQAPRWLAAVQETLATHDCASHLLDVLGPAAGPRSAPAALLFAAGHLLAWAKTIWAELAHHQAADRLRFLWHWGSAHRLGRLV